MTTVSFKENVLASDGKITGHPQFKHVGKGKWVTKFDVFIGVAGDIFDIPRATSLISEGEINFPPDKIRCLSDGCQLLVITKSRELIYFKKGEEKIEINDPFYAIGSGEKYAYNAMLRGCGAIESIKEAAKHDPGTGYKVYWINIETGEVGEDNL